MMRVKYYGIDATYPYFIPAPTLFGTFGAVIRIRSPIITRRVLFDIGIAGADCGFLVAVGAMAYAIASAKIVPGVRAERSGRLRQSPADTRVNRSFASWCGPQLAAASARRTRGLGRIICYGAESASALATRWRAHCLQHRKRHTLCDAFVCAGCIRGPAGKLGRHIY